MPDLDENKRAEMLAEVRRRQARGRRPRMEDVARLAQVSPMTVSRALNASSPVAAETRRRVLEVVDEIGYVPDQIASGLSSQRSGFVAILVPSLNNPHFGDTLGALSARLSEAGLQVLIGHTDYKPDGEEKLIETMLGRRPEVIVLTYDGHTDRSCALLDTAGIPVIEIWETPREPLGHVVGFSNFEAARGLTAAMVEKGYKRLCFVGERVDEGTRGSERRAGFQAALQAAGLDCERCLSGAPPPITMTDGARSLPQILERWPDTDAIVAVSDPCAFGLMTECQRRGISVPDQIAIAGFGDFEVSRLAEPGLTTVGVDASAIGWRTGDLIVEIRDAEQAGDALPPQTVIVPANPLMRRSA
ncbi:MAG: LacI family DNA-binding transcriptional regulator [Pseudomonadota bacterium]